MPQPATAHNYPDLDSSPCDAAYRLRLRERDVPTVTHFTDFFYVPIRNKIRHGVSSKQADDLVQDVFVAIFSRIDAGEPQDPAKLAGYVFGICRHILLRNWDPKRHINLVDADLSLFADARDRADIRLIKKLDQGLVHRIIQRMQPRDREVIERIIFQEQDRPTAAREMGVTQDNLRLILCRALKRFRTDWDSLQ